MDLNVGTGSYLLILTIFTTDDFTAVASSDMQNVLELPEESTALISPVLQRPTENYSPLPNANLRAGPSWTMPSWKMASHNSIELKQSNRKRKPTGSNHSRCATQEYIGCKTSKKKM